MSTNHQNLILSVGVNFHIAKLNKLNKKSKKAVMSNLLIFMKQMLEKKDIQTQGKKT